MVIRSFVSARINSSRLPNKCLLPFGNCNVLEHGIRRAKENGLNPIVCTPSSNENDLIAEIAMKENVPCFRGHNDDRLRRWLDCAIENDIDAFHTVDVDDPFFDPDMMKLSFSTLLENDYDYVEPTKLSSDGNACVGYSLRTSFISKVCALYSEGENSELLWNYLEAVKDRKSEILSQSKNFSSVNARLTLDYEEDYWLLSSICRILGNQAKRKDVDDLLTANPDFKNINWFRNNQWKERQLSGYPTNNE